MSRTKRSKQLNNVKCWNWKHKSAAHIVNGQRQLYEVDKKYVWKEEDLLDELYKVRVRHSCKGYPYYTSTWDDISKGATKDKWCQHKILNYHSKKHVW